LTNQEVRARALETLTRKREEKKVEKDERKSRNAGNIAKAPNNVLALLEDLNELAEKDLEKKPEVDKHGKPVPVYFYTKHAMEDLDCIVDLTNLDRKDVKRAMKFSEDDLLYAGNMKFLQNMRACTDIAGRRQIVEPPGWITERIKLAELMEKEVWVTVEHPTKKHLPVKCRNIIMIVGRKARFIQHDDWKEGDKEI
jgi:hypothetical protein